VLEGRPAPNPFEAALGPRRAGWRHGSATRRVRALGPKEALAAARDGQSAGISSANVIHCSSGVRAAARRDSPSGAAVLGRALELATQVAAVQQCVGARWERGLAPTRGERPSEAAADYVAARELFAEIGNTTAARPYMIMMIGRAAFGQGPSSGPRRVVRDAVRMLKGIGRPRLALRSQRLSRWCSRAGPR